MTTIVVAEKEIGWDSQISFGNEKYNSPVSKVVVNEYGIWAGAGSPALNEKAMIILVDGGCLGEDENFCRVADGHDSGGFELIRIWEDDLGVQRRRMWSNNAVHGFTPPMPTMIGSGGAVALGAYWGSDGSVQRALEVAVQCDEGSGGPIHVVNIQQMLDAARNLP